MAQSNPPAVVIPFDELQSKLKYLEKITHKLIQNDRDCLGKLIQLEQRLTREVEIAEKKQREFAELLKNIPSLA